MANKNNNICGVDNLVESAFVPDSRESGVRASNLSYDAKTSEKWKITPIITYVKHNDVGGSLFSAIDAMVEKNDEHMQNGKNHVYLEGCTLYHNNEDGKEMLKLVLKNTSTGVVEENIALFPGNEYTDRYGVVHEAGHNWLAFAEEVKRQYNEQHFSYSAKGGFIQLLKTMTTYGFDTWLLYDGKYLNMYVTEQKYQYALDRLASMKKAGNPEKKEEPKVEKKTKKAKKGEVSDEPPFSLDIEDLSTAISELYHAGKIDDEKYDELSDKLMYLEDQDDKEVLKEVKTYVETIIRGMRKNKSK